MTLHVAAVYFDYEKKACGFLLGADRLGVNRPKEEVIAAYQGQNRTPSLDDRILAEKSFHGENTLGFCSGTFLWPKNEQESLFRSFDNCFDDIGKRRDYSNHPTLQRAYEATLSIVKRGDETLELYGVYKRHAKGGKLIAVRRYLTLTRESFSDLKGAPYWTRLNVPKKPALSRAPGKQPLEHMQWLLILNMALEARKQSQFIAPPFDFYAIDFDGIRKVA